MLVDAHLHAALSDDPDRLCAALARSAVTAVCVSTSSEDALLTADLAHRHGVIAMIGIHPWYAADAVFPRECFETLCARGLIRGIGEIGLDPQAKLPLAGQIELCLAQLDFARDAGLPVSLHVRKCHGQLLRLLRRYGGGIRGMVHNFTFSEDLAREYLRLNLSLSVGRHITARHEKHVRALRLAGPDRVFTETDMAEGAVADYPLADLEAGLMCLADAVGLEPAALALRMGQSLGEMFAVCPPRAESRL